MFKWPESAILKWSERVALKWLERVALTWLERVVLKTVLKWALFINYLLLFSDSYITIQDHEMYPRL